jgi:hypothetical protein
VRGEHCFLYFLSRYHTPSARQVEDQKLWHYDYSTLSKMFNAVVEWCDDTHRYRLRSLPLMAHKFQYFNDKILQKMHSRFPGAGPAARPPHAENCALFGDGSRFEVAYITLL